MSVAAILGRAAIEPGAPENLRVLTARDWAALIAALQTETTIGVVALFVARDRVFLLLRRGQAVLPVAAPLIDGRYRAVSPARPEASWYERLARDLAGAVAEQALDERPAIALGAAGTDAAWPRFREVAGEGLYQIGSGPVGGTIATPCHRRAMMDGEILVGAEHRFGYAHRGILGLIAGKSPRAAARFCARIDAEASVAHALAFARAAEAASFCAVPAYAKQLRCKMLAIEICNVALIRMARLAAAIGADRLATRLVQLRARIADALERIFAHRFMMDTITPGGLAAEPDWAAWPMLADAVRGIEAAMRPFGGWRMRAKLGPNAALALDWARRACAAATEAGDLLAGSQGEAIMAPLPDRDGFGIGVAASAHGSIHCVLSIELGMIGFGFIAGPGIGAAEALEESAIGMRAEDVSRRSILAMPSVGGIDL